MLEDSRIIPFIFTFLPALVYAALIYLSAPYKSIGRKMSQLYFHMGLVSTVTTLWFLWVFPRWHDQLPFDPIMSMFILAFFQIGLLEESMKFMMFKSTERYRIKRASPVAIMFYCMCVSAGFAVMENVMYLQMYGNDVLVIRAFSAIMLHMITGLIMGYFMAVSRMRPNRKYLLQAVGLLAAVFYHGMYDFNIMVRDFGHGIPTIITLLPGMIVIFFMWRHLKRSTQRVV